MFSAIWADWRRVLRILRQVLEKECCDINSVCQGVALGECYKIPDVIVDIALFRLFVFVEVEFLRVTLITVKLMSHLLYTRLCSKHIAYIH